jgi:hypothetical protein
MSKSFFSYRELVADALSPKPLDGHADVLIVTDLQFKPSRAALEKADAVRQRIRSEMAEPVSAC